jgi:hypothetical protein
MLLSQLTYELSKIFISRGKYVNCPFFSVNPDSMPQHTKIITDSPIVGYRNKSMVVSCVLVLVRVSFYGRPGSQL